MLLLIDNVKDPDDLNKQDIVIPNDLGDTFLSLGCNIIFTTRKSFEMDTIGVVQKKLEVLSPEASYDLLTVGRKPDVNDEEEYANKICNCLGYLPLVIVLVQKYMNKNQHVSFERYYNVLKNKRLNTLDYMGS